MDQLKIEPTRRKKITALPAKLECSNAKRMPEVASMGSV
jgi:hypothetical protein